MSDLDELYQEVILDHNRSPRNFRVIAEGRQAEGYNPLCGDKITVYVQFKDGRIVDVSFQRNGCAISQASASVMTTALRGKTQDEADDLFHRFQNLVTGKGPAPEDLAVLGELAALAGVSEFPTRVKCATLAWHTLNNALASSEDVASTE